jgi:CBS-domain-containing membrane protein
MPFPLVTGSMTIAEAIDAIQLDLDRGVVVIDGDNHVVGIVTEGDLLRALRRGSLLESQVSSIVTGQVHVTTRGLSPSELAVEFVDNGTLLIPIVDSERRLIDIQRSRDAVRSLIL